MLLLTETGKVRIQNEGQKTFLEGIYLQSETLNKNNRIYPRRVLENAVDSLQDKIRNRELFGELSHSNETSVNLTRASHIIESLRRRGNDWFGRSRVIDEGNGRILKSILDCGGRVGMSSRGFGSLLKNQAGHNVVQEDYRMITADAVSDPSAPGAFMNAVHEAIRSGQLSLLESSKALSLIKETEALASVKRPDGSSPPMKQYDQDEVSKDLFAGHAGFPSIEDARTALERCDDHTARILAGLLGIADESGIDNEGLEKSSVENYVNAIRDPIERAQMKRELWLQKQNEVMRNRALDVLTRLGRMYGPK
jgi:hypothetical protein